MVEFDMKIHKQGTMYMPKEIRKTLGQKVKGVPNQAAVVLFPSDLPKEAVIKSLTIIIQDIQHGVDLEKEKQTSESK